MFENMKPQVNANLNHKFILSFEQPFSKSEAVEM